MQKAPEENLSSTCPIPTHFYGTGDTYRYLITVTDEYNITAEDL